MKREEWVDTLKGIGILLVIVGHTNSPFFKLIYGFHMPLFFMISGFLYNEESAKKIGVINSIKKDAKRYLYPYFILSGLNLIISFLFELLKKGVSVSLFNMTGKWLFGIFWSYGNVAYLPNCTPLWFFVGLFVARIFLYLILKLKSDTYRISACIGFIVVDYGLSIIPHMKLPWNIDAAMIGCVCMYAGYTLRKFFFQKVRRPSLINGVALCLLGFAFIMLNGNVAVLPNQLANPILFWGGALLTSAGLIICSSDLKINSVFLQKLGWSSAIVMGLNYVVRDLIRTVWIKFSFWTLQSCPWYVEAITTTVMLFLIARVWDLVKHKYRILERTYI